MPNNWHVMKTRDVENELNTSSRGLSEAEAAARLEKYGLNELQKEGRESAISIFFGQFKDFMIIILLIAAAISAFVAKEYIDSIVILILVIINAVIGTVQEIKAQNSLDALQKMAAPQAKVIRDGVQKVIPSRDLVPGDYVVLDTGDHVPADIRLTEYASLKIQEAALTGESVPVEKHETELKEDAPIGDRINMAYSSSLVTYGRGRGVVIGTGMNTEVGKIATMIQEAPQTETPMQKRLSTLGKTLGIVALSICAIMFGIGLLRGRPAMHMFMSAISLAVAAIPEGLPAISTIVLALGVQRMAKRNAIVRTLPSVETLGSATVICSDKTGTLTQNKMTVLRFALSQDEDDKEISQLNDETLLRAAVLCTDAQITERGPIGDPTETALVEMGLKLNCDKEELERETPRVSELPFDSERKRMSTAHKLPNGKFAVYVKGGLDEVLAVCTKIRTAQGVKDISKDDIEALNKLNRNMASEALRVLAFAIKEIDAIPSDLTSFEKDLTYVGMTGMIDPPRKEAGDAVEKCHTAGIIPVMITGDHAITATAIAKELDILQEGGRVVVGTEIEKMSDEDLYNEVEHISVYARVSPEHKVRIVEAWQNHGHVVAMTGDGVNDAPALKRADIGCAMGEVGTDVAKDSADLILVDDNFATIVAAIEEGRRIFDNVLKTVSFLLSCNIGEILTLFIATLVGWEEPLLPIHLLLVNLVTDGLPALALGVDPATPGIMERKARKQEGIFTKGMVWRLTYQGIMVGALTLCAFMLGLRHTAELGHEQGLRIAQTMAFTVLAMCQIAHSFNLRSYTKSIFVVHPFQNKALVGAGALSLLITLLCINLPGLNDMLKLIPLRGSDLIEAILLSITPIVVVEIFKLLKINTVKGE